MTKAWDLPTRVFHWTLVCLVILSWVSAHYGDTLMAWHQWNGHALIVFIISRIIWGFVGSTSSRFSLFLRSPVSVIQYLLSVTKSDASLYLSHNPAGGWMVVLLLGVTLLQAITGLFATDDILVVGPLRRLVPSEMSEILTEYHRVGFTLVLTFVGVHLLAVMYHQVIGRDPIIYAMLTGYKPDRLYADGGEMLWHGWISATSIVAVTAISLVIVVAVLA